MSNVLPVVWRGSCPLGLRVSARSLGASSLRKSIISRSDIFSTFCFHTHQRQFANLPWRHEVSLSPRYAGVATGLAGTAFRRFAKTNARPAAPRESGIRLDIQPFPPATIKTIFGSEQVSPEMGNRIVSVLHGRRVAGTLDLPLPSDMTRAVRPKAIENGLRWLREHYPMDEDAAIMARIEREEREEEERLYRYVKEQGLHQPQSGHWGARLGDGEDIRGESVFKKIRETNEAKNKVIEEKERKEWLEGEAAEQAKLRKQWEQNTQIQKYNEAAVVEARPRADPKERPFLAWAQKHYLRAENNDADFQKLSTAGRILPALGVTLLTLGLCYVYAETYEPPKEYKRLWRDVPPAAATVLGIISVNLAVYLLWKTPPAWRMLNRYFISVPLYPYAMSVVGSIFSHQQFRHLATNTLILWLIGTRLHDEIGRGNFMAVYLSSGVIGSITSLTAHVLLGRLAITSLGASGAIAGLVAAWCMLHSDDKLVPSFLPHDWRESVAAKGSTVLAAIVLFELFNLVSPFKVAKLDYWAHLGGYFAGAAWAMMHKPTLER